MAPRETMMGTVSAEDDPSRAGPLRRPARERALPWVIALVFACLYTTVSVARFQRLGTRSFDLGIFEQAIHGYAHLQAPIVDIEGAGHNFLGDHWNPAIAIFAPFYRLFPGSVTLLVGQSLLIALAVVPITRAGMLHLSRWSGVAVGLAFGMSYGVQAAVDFDFHEVCLAAPLLAFALEAFLSGRWPLVVAWAAPLVLVKEDLGLTVAALGVVLVLVGAQRWGLGLAAFGLASAALTMKVLIPAFSTESSGSRLSDLTSQSGTGDSLIQRILNLPLAVVTPGPRSTTVFLLLVVTAFLCLRSPLMILVLPTLAWRLLSTNENYWVHFFHYDLVLMVIVFAALIDGVRQARRVNLKPLRWYSRAAPTLALLVGLRFCPFTAFGDLVDPATYQPGPRVQAAERILKEIPDGATVEADFGVMAKLTHRTRVFRIFHAAPVVPQFVLIDARTSLYPPPRDPVQFAQSLHPGTTYTLVDDGDGFTLMRRVP